MEEIGIHKVLSIVPGTNGEVSKWQILLLLLWYVYLQGEGSCSHICSSILSVLLNHGVFFKKQLTNSESGVTDTRQILQESRIRNESLEE